LMLSGTATGTCAKATNTHGGGSGVDELATNARWASSTAPTTIDGPSEALGHVCIMVGAETAGPGDGDGAGAAAGLQPIAPRTVPAAMAEKRNVRRADEDKSVCGVVKGMHQRWHTEQRNGAAIRP
jgi:hypothetical protein